MLNVLSVKNFTAFGELRMECAPGLNVLIGRNGTGKSHLLKLLYAVCAAKRDPSSADTDALARSLTDKLVGVFKPEQKIGRLCRDGADKTTISVEFALDKAVGFGFSGDMKEVTVTDNKDYEKYSWEACFIPPKEMLSSFPGFSALYTDRKLTIDETYFDLCQALELPELKTVPPEPVGRLLSLIEESCGGRFLLMKKRFYYKPKHGRMLEVELSAEGYRKLGILHRLMQTGRINPGVSGPLFWDEPEANLNPSLMKDVVTVLVELARAGQQVFVATHDYVILKWIDLLTQEADQVRYHSLDQSETGAILNSTADYLQIHPNAIDDTFAELVDKDVEESMGGLGK